MPTKPPKDEPTPQPQKPPASEFDPAAEAPVAAAAETDTEPTGPAPGVYEYTHFADCIYPHVPLTARAAYPGHPATEDDPGEPAVDATVFNWPFGAPDDGRWTKTRKKPNQAADNAGPLTSEE